MWLNARKASQANRPGSRSSQTSRTSHVSGIGMRGSQPREIEFQFFIRQTETLYPPWWTRSGIIEWYRNLPDDTLWNCYICGCVLLAVVWTVAQMEGIYLDILDVIYNISYAIHVFAIGYKLVTELENTDITFWTVVGFLVDLGSFAHYVKDYNPIFKLTCYYVRLHRPYKYLWSLNDYNLKGSILGTTLKYCYIFMVVRITCAYVWLHIHEVHHLYDRTQVISFSYNILSNGTTVQDPGHDFLSSVYIINKMFIPIGPSEYPDTDIERICCILIMVTGCLAVTGSAVASMSLIISLYMRPEETFRARFRLITKEMKETEVPAGLREKVNTFYKMYWHKQRAVSQTQLLPTFPPTLPATINMDIYYEATQKARILRELSYQILSELARKMETIHYIPGDAIIKRGSKKCKIIFITYGDVEMLTAEDDSTPIKRMTRGTVLTPCGGAVAAALGISHLAVRAATFCTAHVLTAVNLWKVVSKHSVTQDHAGPILAAFTDHIERVKRHYMMKIPDNAVHKSSILLFNRNLMALKDMKDVEGESVLASSDVFLEVAGCYIMRNRPDATLTDQSDEICLRPVFPCILQPTSSLLVAWHSFVAMLILAVCIYHPYYLVYKKTVPLEFRFFDYIVTAVYILDHIVHLSTGANVEEGVPITFTQTSSQQMRSRWFVLDVVGTLPIFEFIGTGHFAGINKILRLPKLFRVLKSLEESCVYRSNVLRFLSYTLLLLIACYLIATMQQGFMCFQSGYCLVTNLTHRPFWSQKPLDEETVNARIWFGLYWAISMITFTFHRETFGMENWRHLMYTLLILESCIILRIFMEAVYAATIMVTTALREDYGARIETVKSFLIRNEVDPILRKRFIGYLQLCWYTDKAYKMTHKTHSTIFYDLPHHVFQDIVGRNRMKYITAIPFMRMLKKDDLGTLSSNAKLFYTSPNEILINTGELTNEIYIIKKGICEILDPQSRKPIGQLTAKDHFGALICLLRLPAYYTIRAVTHVQVLCLSRKYLMRAIENPHIKQTINYLKMRPEYQRLQMKVPSFIKYEPLPPTPNMMRFRLPRKHEPDAEFLLPFKRLGFLSILRYIFPRFTIRPDGKYLQRYEWFRVFCALSSAQLFPHYTYLVLQWPWLYYVALFLDMSAWFDILQRMLIGYFNKDGILVYHPSSTAAYYLKGPFLADMFGCLSLENLESVHKDSIGDKFRVTPTKQFLMLNRLIQLYRMPSAMMMLKDYIERRDILLVFQAIPLFMAVLNVLTSFMIFYSVIIYYSVDKDDNIVWWILPLPDHGGSWLHLFKNAYSIKYIGANGMFITIEATTEIKLYLNGMKYMSKLQLPVRFNMTETPWNLHLATYFWVVYECSTTGYGTFNPSNQELTQVLFIGMAISTMIITYYSVRITSVRANVNKSLARFQQHMKDINVYLAREKLHGDLQKEIRRYYEYNWEKMGGIDYRGVLKLCDQITLRTDAILHIYGPTFAKCPVLANADVSLLRIIGRSVRTVHFLRDMMIIDNDDIVSDMYIVNYGGVEIRIVAGEMSQVIRLPRGSVFGNLEGTACHRSPYSVVATGRLHLMMIKSAIFFNITKDFPAVQELMVKSRAGEKKMYILGGDAQMKMRRTASTGAPPRKKTSVLKYIFFQEGPLQYYLLAVCLGCIYLDMYNAGYQNNSMWLIITVYTLDFAFFLKIFTQHVLPFFATKTNLKKIMLPIRKLYFKREFKYDLISILPIELISFALKDNRWMWFAWLRLNRTFRVATVYKCLKHRNESITVNLTVTTIMAVLIWFTLFVHATTCMWYFIGSIEDSFKANSSWIYRSTSGPSRRRTDASVTHCNNHYICSVYFVITTFTQNGVGDIMPKNHSEVIFVAILMILSTMVFMVYVGEFSNIIQYQSYRSFSFYSKYLELQEFMHNNRVSKNLVTIVNKYTLHLWRETRGKQVPHFLKDAPLSLRLRVMSAAYLHHITRHHIFEECEPAFLRQLCGCLRLYTYNEGMYVAKESEITNSMYVIHTGKVRETCEEMDISARVYPAGSYFGILQGLIRNTPYTHSYQTMTKSQVLTLNLDHWEYLLKHFPDSRDTIHKHMRQVGDDDTDKSNWPGGTPVSVTPAYEPLSEMTDIPDMPDLQDQYPTTSRPFHRQSEAEENTPRRSSMRRTSQFSWPTDNKGGDDVRAEDRAEVEDVGKEKFFKRFVKTAKKIMGRVSNPEALAAVSGEGKDELLLEEDEEATEALLAQFEKAKKMTEKDVKKTKGRRKSMFFGPEEMTEKHLFTLDMDEPKTEESGKTESHPVSMQSLRIRDSENEVANVSGESTGKVLNLGRPKANDATESSEFQVAIDMTKSKTAQDTMETQTSKTVDTEASEKSLRARKELYKRPLRQLYPSYKDQDTLETQPSAVNDGQQAGEETRKPKTQVTKQAQDAEMNRAQTTEASQDSQPVQEDPLTKALDTLYPSPEIGQHTQRAEATQGITDALDDLPITVPPKLSPTPNLFYPNAEETKDDQIRQEIQDTQALEDETQNPAEMPKDSESTKHSQDMIDIQPNRDTTGAKVTQDADTQPTHNTSGIQTTQATKGPWPDQDITGTQATLSTKDTPTSQDKDTQAMQDIVDSSPIHETTGVQTTQDARKIQLMDTTGTQIDQGIEKTQEVKKSTSIQAVQNIEAIQPTRASTGVQTVQEKDTLISRDTTGTQAILNTKNASPQQTTTGIQATKDIKDISRAKGTQTIFDTEDGQDTFEPPAALLSDTKVVKSYSGTSFAEDPTPQQSEIYPTTSTGTASQHKRSFSKKPIIYDPGRGFLPNIDNIPTKESSIPPIKTAISSVSEVKLLQYMSETDEGVGVDKFSETSNAGATKTERSESEHNVKEQTTHTSASKLNRRFVHVRYEEKSDNEEEIEEEEDESKPPDQHLNIFTLDSDEPSHTDRSAAGSTGGDDEATTSTSTSDTSKKRRSNARKYSD